MSKAKIPHNRTLFQPQRVWDGQEASGNIYLLLCDGRAVGPFPLRSQAFEWSSEQNLPAYTTYELLRPYPGAAGDCCVLLKDGRLYGPFASPLVASGYASTQNLEIFSTCDLLSPASFVPAAPGAQPQV